MKMLFLKILGFSAVLTVVAVDAARVSAGRALWVGQMAARVARVMDLAEANLSRLLRQQRMVAQQRLAMLQPMLRQRILQRQLTPRLLARPEVRETVNALGVVDQSEQLMRDVQLQRNAASQVLPKLSRQRAEEIVAGFEKHGPLFRVPELLRREPVDTTLSGAPEVAGQEAQVTRATQLQDERARLRARLSEIEGELGSKAISTQEAVPADAAAVQQ